MNADFLPQKGGFRNLIAYKLSDNIYNLTYLFAHKFLKKGDRTIDQMIQAARSCKQNIAEGSAASTTSKETEIKLTNVAKASLQELLLDYEDFLMTRGQRKWKIGDPPLEQTRSVIRQDNPTEYYIDKAQAWNSETFANVVVTMIHACDRLLYKLIEKQKLQFLQDGGIREEMSRARREYRSNQTDYNNRKTT
jgi:four helix bundle suffix protein